nr:lipopolysaccharide assembly protein LapA domain-containing protein [Pseudomonas sp. UBA6718]
MLASIKRLLLALGLLLAGGVVLLFVLENSQRTHLIFLGWPTPELPVTVLMAVAFMLGMLFCLLFNLWLLARLRLHLARQQRELSFLRRQAEQQS